MVLGALLPKVKNKKEVWSWAFYDFANSSYSVMIISLVFAIYFRNVIAGGGPNADLIWGIVLSISILLGGILSPFIGAMTDATSRRKPVFVIFSLTAIAGTALLYFAGPGSLIFASIVFVITNFSFEIASVIYDSFLSLIVRREQAGSVSGLGWGLGYLGGLLAALLFAPLYISGYEANDSLYRLTFPLTAVFFLVFALPSYFWLRERGRATAAGAGQVIRKGFSTVFHTLSHIRSYKNIFLYYTGWYLLHDGLFTLIAFTGIFAVTTLGLNLANVLVLFVIIHAVGFLSTIISGFAADKWGNKRVLLWTIVGWIIATFWLAFTSSLWQFYTLAVLGGLVIGSSQAAARSLLSIIVPLEKSSEFFGFNSFASKLAATLGPLVFGIVSSATGNQRIAVLSLLIFFISSFAILLFVKEERSMVSV